MEKDLSTLIYVRSHRIIRVGFKHIFMYITMYTFTYNTLSPNNISLLEYLYI